MRSGRRTLALHWITCIAVASQLQSASAQDFAWKKIEVDETLSVYSAIDPGNQIVALRAIAELPAPIGKVVAVLRDTARQSEWVDRLVEVRVLEQVSPSTRIEYNHTSLPWPLRDRDFVYESKMNIDKYNGRISFLSKSVLHGAAPVCERCIRATIFQSSFVLTPSEDRTRTRAEVILHVDPEGSIPKWLVNWVQKRIPRNTVERLLEQLKKPDILEYPLPASFRARLR